MAAFFLGFIPQSAFANQACRVFVPEDCEIKNTSYSTGGNTSTFEYVEVDCQMPDGRYVKYMDNRASWAAAFGARRWQLPPKITFVKRANYRDSIKLTCN